MQQQQTQYDLCSKAIDEHQFIPLTIGPKHYETFHMLQSDFGDDITMLIQKKLCKYFAQGIKFQGIEDKKDRDLITKFLEKRITLLENNGQLATNTSFAGLAKRDAITQLNEIIKTLGDPTASTTATTATTTAITKKMKRTTLLEQLWIGMYKVANLEEDDIVVDTNLNNLLEAIDTIAPDEALRDAANLTRAKSKGQIKTNANSLEKYITNSTISTSKDSTGVNPTSTDTTLDDKKKEKLIQLLVLFKTTNFLRESKDENINKDFVELSKNIPGIIDNIFFYNRSIIRFYKSQYPKITEVYDNFFDKRIGRIVDLRDYPIEQMIQIVYILFNLEQYINSIFPKNQGLLRLTLSSKTDKLIKLIELYANYINDQLSAKQDKNSVDPSLNINSLDYELIHIHTRTSPIMQLIHGKQINFNKDIMNDTIDKLKLKKGADTLKSQITKFFDKRDTELYIIYQQAPKNTKISQLDDLQCVMANITDEFIRKQQETTPISIEATNDKDKTTGILASLTINNTFKEFGITTTKPLPLVSSITQISGTILNATYINKRLKKAKGINN